tara:strand:+ start:137 stop:316 length:180 start_codon:yes stop_codon:yes gene_type:complete
MNKFNSFKDSSLKKNITNEEDYIMNESDIKYEKVLCNHCGRTKSNGIRCKGICVADNDY